MENIQGIYNRDISISKQGRPRCSIIEETYIELVDLAGNPYLKAIFDRYGLG